MSEKAKTAGQEIIRALDFFDRVKAASSDEQIAVGTDHWDWLENACRAYKEAVEADG